MSNIQTFLEKILSARYGKDVRQSIHDAIHQCYEDGKAGSVDLTAREEIGVIEELTTGVKDTIVKAINWLNNSLTTLSNSLVALAKRVGANETAISDLNTKTNGLYSDLDAKIYGVELWENKSTTSDFTTQTITLSDSINNYSFYEIEYIISNSNSSNRNTRSRTSKITKSRSTILNLATRYNYTRDISAPSGNTMVIGDCLRYTTYGTDTTALANGALIPYKVRAYK